MPIYYEAKIIKLNTVNELQNLGQKVQTAQHLKYSPKRRNNLINIINEKINILTLNEIKNGIENEINKLEKSLEEKTKKYNKKSIILLS